MLSLLRCLCHLALSSAPRSMLTGPPTRASASVSINKLKLILILLLSVIGMYNDACDYDCGNDLMYLGFQNQVRNTSQAIATIACMPYKQ
jgi:hypothetical protein